MPDASGFDIKIVVEHKTRHGWITVPYTEIPIGLHDVIQLVKKYGGIKTHEIWRSGDRIEYRVSYQPVTTGQSQPEMQMPVQPDALGKEAKIAIEKIKIDREQQLKEQIQSDWAKMNQGIGSPPRSISIPNVNRAFRDAAALAALPAILSCSKVNTFSDERELAEWASKMAFVLADAMGVARDAEIVQPEQNRSDPTPEGLFGLEVYAPGWPSNWLRVSPTDSKTPEELRQKWSHGEVGEYRHVYGIYRVVKLGGN